VAAAAVLVIQVVALILTVEVAAIVAPTVEVAVVVVQGVLPLAPQKRKRKITQVAVIVIRLLYNSKR
jgi:hypothetical protein